MKKYLLTGAMLVMCGALLSQEVQKPYAYAFNGGIGDCTFTGVTLDQVWAAASKVLLLEKFKITSAEKQSGLITAQMRDTMSWRSFAMYDLSLYFEQRGESVVVTASISEAEGHERGWYVGAKKSLQKVSHKEEKKFFDKVAEILYGSAKQESTTKGDGTHA